VRDGPLGGRTAALSHKAIIVVVIVFNVVEASWSSSSSSSSSSSLSTSSLSTPSRCRNRVEWPEGRLAPKLHGRLRSLDPRHSIVNLFRRLEPVRTQVLLAGPRRSAPTARWAAARGANGRAVSRRSQSNNMQRWESCRPKRPARCNLCGARGSSPGGRRCAN